jgi:transcriptional regulator with XRE-family HTH domain
MPAPLNLPPDLAELWARWGAEIARTRHAAGLTQVEMADALGVSASAVRHWEQGIRGASLSVRRRVVTGYGADPDVLQTADDSCPCCRRPFEANSRRRGRR